MFNYFRLFLVQRCELGFGLPGIQGLAVGSPRRGETNFGLGREIWGPFQCFCKPR